MKKLSKSAYLVENYLELQNAVADWDRSRQYTIAPQPTSAFPMIACMSKCNGQLRVESISEATIGAAGYFKQAFPEDTTTFECDFHGCRMTAVYTEKGVEHAAVVALDDEAKDSVMWVTSLAEDKDDAVRIERIITAKCRAEWEKLCAT